jgi:hypothetical protein
MNFYYPANIWLAFGETFEDNQPIIDWLLKNGFPEVAALSHAMRGSDDAFSWLMKNGFLHLAAFDSAVTSVDPKAYLWLKKNKHPFLMIFSDACRGKEQAIKWLMKNNLHGFVMIAGKVKKFCDSMTFDYHKKQF